MAHPVGNVQVVEAGDDAADISVDSCANELTDLSFNSLEDQSFQSDGMTNYVLNGGGGSSQGTDWHNAPIY